MISIRATIFYVYIPLIVFFNLRRRRVVRAQGNTPHMCSWVQLA